MKFLIRILTTIFAFLLAVPADAQSNNSGSESRPALSVRRERQSTSSSNKSTTKKVVDQNASAKPQVNNAKNNAATKQESATSKANTAATMRDTAKNANPVRPRFVPKSNTSAANNAKPSEDRAQLDFPVGPEMPSDVSWRRDIYRTLDLTKDENATLYYPLEQQGDQINLFTYMFKLILQGKLKVYEYALNGNENFDAKNEVKPKDLLDRYHIYSETKDGKTHINDSDIPAAEVLEYFIKESSYFDQRTATYHTKVIALCPVLKRTDDFGGADAKYPMFWVKYSDLSPYLAKLPLTGSNYNNAATMSADDYFTMNRYEGKIYKTNNLQGRVLANYCPTDSDMTREQKKIEKQLTDFEQHIWGNNPNDSTKIKNDSVADKKEKKATTSSRRRSSSSSVKASGSKGANSSSSGTARVSVRRQRH